MKAQPIDLATVFRSQKILIVGDVMCDRYLYGETNRISPEAPVPIFEVKNEEIRLGGAANVALNLRTLGARPLLVGLIGKDAAARKLRKQLRAAGITDMHLIRTRDRSTTVKTRAVCGGQQVIRLDKESTDAPSDTETSKILNRAKEIIDNQQIDAVLFQDYDKGTLSKRIIKKIIKYARKADIPTAADPKVRNFWHYKKVTLFKPNLKEIRQALPFRVSPDAGGLDTAAAAVRELLRYEKLLITLAERGIFATENGEGTLYPVQPRAIRDVCGAGDTVIATAVCALAAGLSLSQIALMSNLAGGQVCERSGVVPVDGERLLREFAELPD